MVYEGHIEKGVAVLGEQADIEEGTPVLIEVADEGANGAVRSLADRMSAIIGKARNLPEDAAENHDYYLYGIPKK